MFPPSRTFLILLTYVFLLSEAPLALALEPSTVSLSSHRSPTFDPHSRARVLGARRKGRLQIVSKALSPSNVTLTDWFKGTDLQWFGTISVGTPAQTFTTFFDTGSTDFVIPSTKCTTTCTGKHLFNSAKSTTFKTVSNTATSNSFPLCVDTLPVQGNGCAFTATTGTDVVTVGGLKATGVSMLLMSSETATFASMPFDGITGIAVGTGTYFQSLINQGLPALYGFYMASNVTGRAEMTLGGTDSSRIAVGSTVQFVPSDGFWDMVPSAIFVDGKVVTVPASSGAPPINQTPFIFDTGVANLFLSQPITEAIYALISPSITPFASLPGGYGIPCSQVSSLKSTISFAFTGLSFNLTIPTTDLSVGPFPGQTAVCQMLINSQNFGFNFVGVSLLKHYYTVWDIANSRLGFALPR